MWKRLAFVGVLAGAFLLLLAGVALAEDRVLDQTVCEDGATWGKACGTA